MKPERSGDEIRRPITICKKENCAHYSRWYEVADRVGKSFKRLESFGAAGFEVHLTGFSLPCLLCSQRTARSFFDTVRLRKPKKGKKG